MMKQKKITMVLFLIALLLNAGLIISHSFPLVFVNFEQSEGKIKRLNGINNGPKSGYDSTIQDNQWKIDATKLYQDMNIPFVRTHDSEYPYGQDKFIDIHCIFPDFSENVDNPYAYNFVYTDKYIEAIRKSGAKVFYRLGESINPLGEVENKYTHSPEDYKKWAQICEHIIRHYNEGWANGYHYDIQYWEIWNEPDVDRQWSESMNDYYKFYKVAARYLKEKYPDINVGGAALGDSSEEAVIQFLESLESDNKKTPLDFFSWHAYTNNPSEFKKRGQTIREILNGYGYKDTKSILDEWNYVENWDDVYKNNGIKKIAWSADGGAFIASSLMEMQEADIDYAMYYDGQFATEDLTWCGLYKMQKKGKLEKLPGYYAFSFFDQLYKAGKQVKVEESLDDVYFCAATGKYNAVMISNYNSNMKKERRFILKFNGTKKNIELTRVNKKNPNGVVSKYRSLFGFSMLKIKPGEVIYIKFK